MAVDVSRHHIAVHPAQDLFDHLKWSEHSRHFAVVFHAHFAHLAAPSRGGLQGFGKGHDAGGDQRRIFTQGVAHHHVRLEAIIGEQSEKSHIESEHGRLGDLGLHQIELGTHHRRRLIFIDEYVIGQRPAQDRHHHPIGVGEDLGDAGRDLDQLAPHIRVLAALSGEEIGDLALRRAAAAEYALRFDRLPGLHGVEAHGPLRPAQLLQ